jgi:hypothetical protein
MRTLAFLLAAFFFSTAAFAQATIVKGAPNQTFDLACTQCTLSIEEVALWKGMRVLPYHKHRSGLTNLLHWRYYDSIMKEMVTTSEELPWEKCTQLLDSIASTDTISLQINLAWTDSSAQIHKIYLLIGGLQKNDLAALPIYSSLEGAANEEEIGLKHFAAIAQINLPDNKSETYETISGTISLTHFDPKKVAIGGTFEFEANCIGWIKHGSFIGGKFEKM